MGEAFELMAKSINPILTIAAGICVLVFPHLLNYVVGTYLIVTGALGLSGRS